MVYHDLILKNRNDLTKHFARIREDMKDYMIDVPTSQVLKFPMAVLFQHGSNYLCNSKLAARASLGFFMSISDPNVEAFFKKELYKIVTLPSETSSIFGEIPFKLDLPFSYGMMVFKAHAALIAYRSKNNEKVESNACCLELYYFDEKKSMLYAPIEKLDSFNINKLPVGEKKKEK